MVSNLREQHPQNLKAQHSVSFFFIAISTTCIRLRGLVSAQHGDVA
jgi:hypothetical protein